MNQAIPITLTSPRKGIEAGKVLAAWGVPSSHDDLDALVHQGHGGCGIFSLPSNLDTYAAMAKYAKHPSAVIYLQLLAKVAIFSDRTLSEAAVLVADCMGCDPMQSEAPRERANEWALIWVTFVNAWQARQQCDCVGDRQRLLDLVADASEALGILQIQQAKKDLAERQAKHKRAPR